MFEQIRTKNENNVVGWQQTPAIVSGKNIVTVNGVTEKTNRSQQMGMFK